MAGRCEFCSRFDYPCTVECMELRALTAPVLDRIPSAEELLARRTRRDELWEKIRARAAAERVEIPRLKPPLPEDRQSGVFCLASEAAAVAPPRARRLKR